VIEDINDFEDIVLRNNESQNLVAVMFHAPFCKACQAAAPHFYKLAKRYTGVKFVSVPLTDANSNMVKALGIPKFPFAHIYDPEKGLVDELPILRKLIPKFEERLRSYM
jgi:thiol-disulfide isomerase/thioredoxin